MDPRLIERYSRLAPVGFVKNVDGSLRGLLRDCEIRISGYDKALMEEILMNLPSIIEMALRTAEAEKSLKVSEDKIEDLHEKIAEIRMGLTEVP